MPSQESIRALRTLLLPISAIAGTEERCATVLEETLVNLGILIADFNDWVSISLEQWEESQLPSDDLRMVIRNVLLVAGEVATEALSAHYFDIHSRLLEDHFFSHAEGRWFLSHSFIMLELASKERLTAAQIARMLAVRDSRARFNRHTTETFLNKMRYGPSLEDTQVAALFHADSGEEAPYFADASLEEASEMIDLAARSLGYAGQLATSLQKLAKSEEIDKYSPYLQILHFQCTLAEYFDHALTDLYEFSPRGKAALWLFDAYPEALTRAGNPFLNNAKSVERADAGWVRMKKKGERPGAAALEQVLSNLEMMGFAARRELARLIRLWLHRIMRFTEPFTCTLPHSFSVAEWNAVLNAVAIQNTATFGVLEQRVVDALTWSKHREGWRDRGVGASVNATNISSRRLGDCDYQSSEQKMIYAYESHGGILTDIYVKEHLRTLRKSFALRKEELEGIAELDEWEIVVTFIAHELSLQKYEDGMRLELEGACVVFLFKTFEILKTEWLSDEPNYDYLDQLIIGPLQKKHTPTEVRRVLMTLKV